MKTRLILFLLTVGLLFGCRSKSYNGEPRSLKMKSESAIMLNEDGQIVTPPPPPESNTNTDKKIIKTAYISIEVLNYAASRKLIDSTLKEFSAYIVDENLQNSESQISNSINIKVPSIHFDMFLARLSKIAKKVDYQNIETKDVTEEYIDVETRLSNSRKVEQTYLILLSRTTTIEEILKIEQKLGEIRTDIESTEGRLKYLNHQVSFSSINLNVYQTIEFKYIADKFTSFPQQFKKSLDVGWKGIVAFILFLIKLWPLWGIGTAGWFGWKLFGNLRRQRKKERKRRRKMQKREEQENTNQAQ